MSKTARQHLILGLLSEHSVTSQQQLVDLLADAGVSATRATASRDLEELGAVKVRIAGGSTAYAIPEHPVARIAPEEHLRRVLGDWVADVGASGNLVMVRTPPGSAHVVASALDRAGLEEILGTVAGDDSLIVVAGEGVSGAELAGRLRDLAGLKGRT
ncbi:MAG: arginine repressor [Acidimicrobiaceae bacterium]|nr:arginine repressor [Acidimicrobiaceae bacterium]MCY4279260.1 arginine repressor [Acidimicrobiaceae bacterium]MCY4294670.1 arginine repressor [Acidimicrobiaceae bacterium]